MRQLIIRRQSDLTVSRRFLSTITIKASLVRLLQILAVQLGRSILDILDVITAYSGGNLVAHSRLKDPIAN